MLTPYGEELYDYYIERFHNHVAEAFADIDEEDMRTTIAMIDQTERILKQTLDATTYYNKFGQESQIFHPAFLPSRA